jgi:hypothetical protein
MFSRLGGLHVFGDRLLNQGPKGQVVLPRPLPPEGEALLPPGEVFRIGEEEQEGVEAENLGDCQSPVERGHRPLTVPRDGGGGDPDPLGEVLLREASSPEGFHQAGPTG